MAQTDYDVLIIGSGAGGGTLARHLAPTGKRILIIDDEEHIRRMMRLTLEAAGYEGIYQLATFHPEYTFAGSSSDDPANYTNRSVYPMLHILREAAITKALEYFPDPDGIPQRNIDYARNKGLQYMQWLRASCM